MFAALLYAGTQEQVPLLAPGEQKVFLFISFCALHEEAKYLVIG